MSVLIILLSFCVAFGGILITAVHSIKLIPSASVRHFYVFIAFKQVEKTGIEWLKRSLREQVQCVLCL